MNFVTNMTHILNFRPSAMTLQRQQTVNLVMQPFGCHIIFVIRRDIRAASSNINAKNLCTKSFASLKLFVICVPARHDAHTADKFPTTSEMFRLICVICDCLWPTAPYTVNQLHCSVLGSQVGPADSLIKRMSEDTSPHRLEWHDEQNYRHHVNRRALYVCNSHLYTVQYSV